MSKYLIVTSEISPAIRRTITDRLALHGLAGYREVPASSAIVFLMAVENPGRNLVCIEKLYQSNFIVAIFQHWINYGLIAKLYLGKK